ncbi:3-oxoadipate enol-lactonase [Comamonas guangdongensis]|uniref:3-oxoadipate enol-lactonase n=1 Tax=Comamonas guangdongensis TaxID=510515 RepID=A0ABV3ZWS9_9BURK
MNHSVFQLNTRRGEFRVAVEGDPAAPAFILSNSLGTTLEMWDPQVAALSKRHRLIRYDTRGHGGSPVTSGPYDFGDLGQDVLAVLDALQVEQAAFCGISMGGHTGLWLGIHAGPRFSAIAICNSAAKIGSEQAWRERAAMVRAKGADGMRALAESAPSRWFTEACVQAQPAMVRRMQDGLSGLNPEGYASCCDALAASDLRNDLERIAVPTLLLAGEFDPVCTVADAQAMQADIAGSRLAVVPASHISNLEAPQAFDKAVLDFLAGAAAA